ncbi:MAG: aldo/keto reductase [Chroococcidiopsidaceae cyanobacterium CP_BM_RX_35]|nr:aldo/keto reductase [Chroococcidiopsidaceae cyanobacterium CP_BM_RX_35]
MSNLTRRKFLETTAVLSATVVTAGHVKSVQAMSGAIPQRSLGKTGITVSALGMGGYHLGSVKDEQEAMSMVSRALDAGLTLFDNAWEYHDGNSEKRLGRALKGRRDQAVLMTKVCTHGRDKKTALKMLEDSLSRLGTDHLDIWQIHEVIYDNDPDLIFMANGAAEGLLEAKKAGKVRFVGFTGHKDPEIHLRMLSYGFPFDTVQMPLNCFDATFRSFEQYVLPEAQKQGIAVLGMKSLGGSGEMVSSGAIRPEEGLRYAMSLPVAATISGMDSMAVLEQNLAIAQNFEPYAVQEMVALRRRVRAAASDGRHELFKTTVKYDGQLGREQHHFPSINDLPA